MKPRERQAPWAAFADFAVVPLLLLLTSFVPSFDTQHITALDEGQHLGAIHQLLAGSAPYREVHMVTGPLMQYLPLWWMQLFGVHLDVHRLFYLLGHFVSLLSAFALLRTLVSNPFLKYTALFFVVRFQMEPHWNFVWGGLRWAPGMLALLYLFLWFRDRKPSSLVLAGGASGLGLLLSQEIGIAAAAATGAGMLAGTIGSDRAGGWARELARNTSRFASGFALAVGPFFLFLLAQGAFGDYLRMQFVDALWLFPKEMPYSPPLLSIGALLDNVPDEPLMRSRSLAFYAMMSTCVLILVWTLRRLRTSARDPFSFLLALVAYTMLILWSGTRALQGPQFNATLPVFFVLVAVLSELALDPIGRSQRRGHLDRKQSQKPDSGNFWTAVSAVIAIIAIAMTGNPLRFFETRLAALWNAEPLGAVAALDASLMPRAAGVRVPTGQAAGLNGVVAALIERTKPSDPILTFPFQAHINFLAERPSPTRFHTLLYAGIRVEYMAEVVRDLERTKPRYIVYNPYEYRILDVPNEARLAPVWNYIRAHYTNVAQFGMNQLLERISGEATSRSRKDDRPADEVSALESATPGAAD